MCACTAIHPQGFGWGVMLFQWTLPSPELLCGKINGILPKETNKKQVEKPVEKISGKKGTIFPVSINFDRRANRK
ncbi:MAG: hypothetical protein Q8P67_20870 [archaeon]|nr:hypothetical protein [archaeon]